MQLKIYFKDCECFIEKRYELLDTLQYHKYELLYKSIKMLNNRELDNLAENVSLFFENEKIKINYNFKITIIDKFDFIRDVAKLVNSFNRDLIESMKVKERY